MDAIARLKSVPQRVWVAAAFVLGVALRVWVWVSDLGSLDADEAVTGLMARHVLQGEYPIFFWGQSYGGSQEVFLTAGVFRVAGSSVATLRLVPIGLFFVAAFLLWRTALRMFGERGATTAVIAALVWPVWLVWKSVHAHAYYGVLALCGVGAVWMAVSLERRSPMWRFFLLGAFLGFGLWASPQIGFVAIPIALWLLLAPQTRVVFSGRWTRWMNGMIVAVAGGVVTGAAPWLIWSVENDWRSITGFSYPPTTYWSRLAGFFRDVLPMAMGLKYPTSGRWVVPALVGMALYVVLAALFTFFVAKVVSARDRGPLLLVLIVALFPFIYALSPLTWFTSEPRYLYLLFPVMALIIGWGARRSVSVAGVAVILTMSSAFIGLYKMDRADVMTGRVGGAPLPADYGPMIEALEAHGVRYVIADYWIAYPITFATDEDIIATASANPRYPPYDALVRSRPDPAYVFVPGSPEHLQFKSRLATDHPNYRAIGPAGGFVIYLPVGRTARGKQT